MTCRLMSSMGILEHIESLCFHAKEGEEENMQDLQVHENSSTSAKEKKGNHIPVKLQYYKSKKILAKFIKLYYVNPSQAHAKVFS